MRLSAWFCNSVRRMEKLFFLNNYDTLEKVGLLPGRIKLRF